MDTSTFFAYPTAQPPPQPDLTLLPEHTERDWATLLSHTQTRRFRRGETVLAAGERDRALYLLTDGRLQRAGGQIAAPAIVGEAEFFDGRPRQATLIAATDGEILRLGFDAFEALAAREPVLARDLLLDLGRILAARLRTG